MRTIDKNVLGEMGFFIEWTDHWENTEKDEKYYIDFKAYKVVGIITGDKEIPIFERIGSTGSGDETEKIEEAQPYIDGTIKWDSCAHFTFGEQGYIHFCGYYTFKEHIELIAYLYKRAFELMGREPDGREKWKEITV